MKTIWLKYRKERDSVVYRRVKGQDNIKTDLRGVGCEGVDWIHLAQNTVYWRAFLS
jgi:hypothetical protein